MVRWMSLQAPGLVLLWVASEYFRNQEAQDVLLFIDNILGFTPARSKVIADCMCLWLYTQTFIVHHAYIDMKLPSGSDQTSLYPRSRIQLHDVFYGRSSYLQMMCKMPWRGGKLEECIMAMVATLLSPHMQLCLQNSHWLAGPIYLVNHRRSFSENCCMSPASSLSRKQLFSRLCWSCECSSLVMNNLHVDEPYQVLLPIPKKSSTVYKQCFVFRIMFMFTFAFWIRWISFAVHMVSRCQKHSQDHQDSSRTPRRPEYLGIPLTLVLIETRQKSSV